MLGEEGKRIAWKVLRLTTGWFLIILGVVGLFLPVLQGILFIISGLAVLSTENRWARTLLEKFSAWRKARRGGKNPT